MRALTIDLGTIEATAWLTIEFAEREKEAEERTAVTEVRAGSAGALADGGVVSNSSVGSVTCAPPSPAYSPLSPNSSDRWSFVDADDIAAEVGLPAVLR